MQYIYGRLEGVLPALATELFCAADKYAMEGLASECLVVMKQVRLQQSLNMNTKKIIISSVHMHSEWLVKSAGSCVLRRQWWVSGLVFG